jgi:hypothetical protein
MAVRQMSADSYALEERIAASARLLEDMAQTCAVLQASCMDQARFLRSVTLDGQVLGHIRRAEQHLAGFSLQHPAPASRFIDGA